MAMPALLMSTLTGPSTASALSIALAIEAVSVTSICTAAARPPWPRISSSRLLSLAVCRAASATAAPCADSTRANCRPSPCEAPVTRMISLLTSNRSGMTNSARLARGRIDTDDFHDRKPVWLTKSERRTPETGRELSMNSFDAVVYLALIVAVVTGFNAGLLRSAVTILAYLIAIPIAVWAMSLMSPELAGKFSSPWAQHSLLFFGIFLIAGMVLGKLMRMALDETIGSEAGIGDRLAGALLGAVRVGLVATTLVLIFDLVPSDRQPSFLTGSQLRPLLSAAGQKGFKSLPPDVTAYIDRLKRDQRI